MKSLDCNQIINLEIIGEEDKNKKNMSTFKIKLKVDISSCIRILN